MVCISNITRRCLGGGLLALFAAEHADAALRDQYRAELGWWAERARDGAGSI